MSRLSFVGRRWRTLLVPFGVFLCLISGFNASAQSLYEDAPILISQPNSTRALTALRTRRGLDTSTGVFQPGTKTLITVYVTNLDELMDGEGKTAFRADVQDARYYRYPLEIVSFEQTVERKWVYALTVRLHGQLEDVGDVLLRVTWRGMASNRVRLAIGHEGGKIQDDPGAVPTPMPDTPPVEETTESLVGLPWAGDRVRFMEQATFGPNAVLESRLRRIGYSAWIAEQMEKKTGPGGDRYSTFAYPPLEPQATNPPMNCGAGTACNRDGYTMYPLQRWFFKEALHGEDQQLRRRVSWALSQIWVVSGRETVQPSRMLRYMEVLDRHAFGNYRDLMLHMTLNPAMGNYLDMASSTRQNPNENYAREILQLFSIGVHMLNEDGTVKLDGQGNPIASYDQNIVNNFTKVFTGWTFCELTGPQCPNRSILGPNYIDPMIVVNPNNHDPSEKRVLVYPEGSGIIPAGLSPNDDMELALNNIFYHPNVPPFVSKLLIQQLVTSNPTPAYVGRVAAVFKNDGNGQRGNLKAVVRAILLDPEARGNIKTDPDYGKLREPVLYITNFMRPFNPAAQANAPVANLCGGLSDGMINNITLTLDQDVLNPPTVFNYYPMDYIIPNTPLAGPEFGIFSTGTALKRPNFVHQMIGPGAGGATGITVVNQPAAGNYTPCGTRIDLSRLQSLATADPSGALLVDTLNREMMHGAMSPQMRGYIMTAVQAVTASDAGLKRARTAVYLVATSPQFQVQR